MDKWTNGQMDKQAAFDEKYKTKQDQSRDENELSEKS